MSTINHPINDHRSPIDVSIPRPLNLEEALLVVTNTVAATGHPFCFSSLDIRFNAEVNKVYTVDPTTLEVHKTEQ